MARVLSGKEAAERLDAATAAEAAALQERGITPKLAVLRVGDRPDDAAYARSAAQRAGRLGIACALSALPADCTEAGLLSAIARVNRSADIHGCLLLRPLPAGIGERTVCDALAPEKDVDCISTAALAGVFTGTPRFAPCTAEACLALLDAYGIDPAGKRVTVVGRSLVVGRPAAMLFLSRDATVTLCHSRTPDLAARCREADIVVAAAGRPHLLGADCFRAGQTVLDVGIHRAEDGTLCGDVSPEAAEAAADAVSPVPGGIGRLTTSILLSHVTAAAKRAASPP